MAKVKAIGIYVRVSSRTQDAASQLPDLERWAKAHAEDDQVVTWYKDTFTGKTMDRPAFNRLMADVEAAKVGSIVVWRLDRLGRTAKGLTTLFDDLRKRRVNLVSIKDGLDLETPAGRLMANVLASVAQYETEVRAERTLAGQAVARGKGKVWGGGTKGKRIKVTTEQEQVIRRMNGEGEKVAAIARATGLSRPTVYNVLAASES
jgi:DNA invertase Pin-like site-specific DNA recombinase